MVDVAGSVLHQAESLILSSYPNITSLSCLLHQPAVSTRSYANCQTGGSMKLAGEMLNDIMCETARIYNQVWHQPTNDNESTTLTS